MTSLSQPIILLEAPPLFVFSVPSPYLPVRTVPGREPLLGALALGYSSAS
jgi:hypothetical protein